MVLKTFQVRELKHLLEENGHDPMPFINPYLETFYKYPAAIKLIMKQVEENENEQKDEQELQEKVQKGSESILTREATREAVALWLAPTAEEVVISPGPESPGFHRG